MKYKKWFVKLTLVLAYILAIAVAFWPTGGFFNLHAGMHYRLGYPLENSMITSGDNEGFFPVFLSINRARFEVDYLYAAIDLSIWMGIVSIIWFTAKKLKTSASSNAA